jgi:hypothetical protein
MFVVGEPPACGGGGIIPPDAWGDVSTLIFGWYLFNSRDQTLIE